ncbi:MAG: hypothetical protein CVU72_01265, partial [Deltaproteobacteria bacterium HGW-Deltaproteobacteria-7]
MTFIILLLLIFLIIWHYRFKELSEKFNRLEIDVNALKRHLTTHEAVTQNLKQPSMLPSHPPAAAEEIKAAPTQSTYVQPVNIPPVSPVPPASIVPPMSAANPPEPVIIPSSVQETVSPIQNIPETLEFEKEKETKPVFEFETTQPSSMETKWQEFKNNVDWEQFTGIKLFAWLGGFALFIGAVLFVKYSIDNNLIPPEIRLVIGALIGLMMITSSMIIDRERYDTTVHTMAAGGIAVLYAVSFTASVYYGFIPKTAGFASFALISAAAFALAVLHKGRFISVLGAIGAYATPLLIQTGHPNLIGLFIYLSFVNI